MTARKPWPAWAAGDYLVMRREARRLSVIAGLVLDHGVNGHRNVALIERMLPRLAAIAAEIRLACLRIQGQRKGEHWPKWAVEALEQIAALSADAGRRATQAEQALHKDHWPVMERSIRAVQAAAQSIESYLLAGPPPAAIGDLAGDAEADEIVTRLFRCDVEPPHRDRKGFPE